MKIAVVGATGLVGGEILTVLHDQGIAAHQVIAAASERSVGKTINMGSAQLKVVSVEEAIALHPDYAIFSAGASTSRQYAPRFAEVGTTVIDNSSAWRKETNIPLVVPEINMDAVKSTDRIIANPNCSTIQMVVALAELHRHYGLRRIVVATYQSITGTGFKAKCQLQHEEQLDDATLIANPKDYPMAYQHPIHHNLFPHGGDFLDDGYTTEEQKLVDETRKIFADQSILVSATVARVPVMGGHSEAVNAEFHHEFDLDEARALIAHTPGVVLQDNPSQALYPMPLYAWHHDEVFVGRVRRDPTQPRTLNLWVVADNLRKGAATNAVQILQQLIARHQ